MDDHDDAIAVSRCQYLFSDVVRLDLLLLILPQCNNEYEQATEIMWNAGAVAGVVRARFHHLGDWAGSVPWHAVPA